MGGSFDGQGKGSAGDSVVQSGIFSGTCQDLSARRRAQERGGNSEPMPAGGLLAGVPLEVRAELVGDAAVNNLLAAFPGAELVEPDMV